MFPSRWAHCGPRESGGALGLPPRPCGPADPPGRVRWAQSTGRGEVRRRTWNPEKSSCRPATRTTAISSSPQSTGPFHLAQRGPWRGAHGPGPGWWHPSRSSCTESRWRSLRVGPWLFAAALWSGEGGAGSGTNQRPAPFQPKVPKPRHCASAAPRLIGSDPANYHPTIIGCGCSDYKS